jgi:predicted ferric reductase
MDRTLAGVSWLALYLVVVGAPVWLMLVPPVPSGRRFLLELAVGLGFAGLTQIAVQFVLIARFKRVTAPYGIDVILQYHRKIAIVAMVAILLHPILIVIDFPARAELLNPIGGNWASRAGWVSLVALLATAVLSIYREPLRLDYEKWRLGHLVLGVLAVVAAQVHVSLAGLYTNTLWKQLVWIGIAAVTVGLVLYLRVVKPARQDQYRWRVAEVRKEAGRTHTVTLDAVDHEGLRFAPGQFAWLKLAGTPYTLDEHPFSFASSAESPKRLEFGVRALGDFSTAIGGIPPGTRAFLDGPHGAFSIDRYPAVGYVFIAGGVGITPFMSFLRTMADRRDPRPVQLLYAEKTQDDIAYADALDALRGRLDLDIVEVLAEPPEEWRGESGFITRELLERRLPKERVERTYFVCGPPPMMTAVHEALLALGVEEARIQMERFNLA